VKRGAITSAAEDERRKDKSRERPVVTSSPWDMVVVVVRKCCMIFHFEGELLGFVDGQNMDCERKETRLIYRTGGWTMGRMV
jgi:hypothetical protein